MVWQGERSFLEAALEGYPQLPILFSSCREQSKGGIIFLLVTLPRIRGNPQSVGFWGVGDGVGVAGDGTGKLNCFKVNMLRYFSWKAISLKGVFPQLTSSVMGSLSVEKVSLPILLFLSFL